MLSFLKGLVVSHMPLQQPREHDARDALVQAGEDNNDNDKIHEGSRTVGVSSVLEGHERHFDDTCELGLNFLFPTR